MERVRSVKEALIKKTAEDLSIDEKIIEGVISWSYHKANEAARTSREIEISGFGTFMITNGRINKRLKRSERIVRLLKSRLEEGRSTDIEKDTEKIVAIEEHIEYCKSKIRHE